MRTHPPIQPSARQHTRAPRGTRHTAHARGREGGEGQHTPRFIDAQRGPRELQSAHILLSGSLMTSLRIFCALSFSAAGIADPLMLKSCPRTGTSARAVSSARCTRNALALAPPAQARRHTSYSGRAPPALLRPPARLAARARAQTHRRVDPELDHVVVRRRHAGPPLTPNAGNANAPPRPPRSLASQLRVPVDDVSRPVAYSTPYSSANTFLSSSWAHGFWAPGAGESEGGHGLRARVRRPLAACTATGMATGRRQGTPTRAGAPPAAGRRAMREREPANDDRTARCGGGGVGLAA